MSLSVSNLSENLSYRSSSFSSPSSPEYVVRSSFNSDMHSYITLQLSEKSSPSSKSFSFFDALMIISSSSSKSLSRSFQSIGESNSRCSKRRPINLIISLFNRFRNTQKIINISVIDFQVLQNSAGNFGLAMFKFHKQ